MTIPAHVSYQPFKEELSYRTKLYYQPDLTTSQNMLTIMNDQKDGMMSTLPLTIIQYHGVLIKTSKDI